MSKNYYIIPIFVPHLGCPNDCVFCNQNRISGKDVNPNINQLYEDVEEYGSTIDRKENPSVELAFFGGSFTGIEKDLQDEYLKMGKHFIDQGKIDSVRVSTRPDYINEEILNNLKKYGVKTIELGVQSLCDEVLINSNRGHSVMDVFSAAQMIKDKGFVLGFQLMPGLPGDNEMIFKETVDITVSIKPDIVRIYPTLVIKDTKLCDMYFSGEYEALSMEDAIEYSLYGFEKFKEAGINVIRIGLQPSDNISNEKDVVAGPFHPSFRELVESEFFKRFGDNLFFMANYYFKDKSVIFYVPAGKKSTVIGNRKSNINYWKKTWGVNEINIVESNYIYEYNMVISIIS
jgi:histone acetyltransferase (RNA polymerase elongator complex component)